MKHTLRLFCLALILTLLFSSCADTTVSVTTSPEQTTSSNTQTLPSSGTPEPPTGSPTVPDPSETASAVPTPTVPTDTPTPTPTLPTDTPTPTPTLPTDTPTPTVPTPTVPTPTVPTPTVPTPTVPTPTVPTETQTPTVPGEMKSWDDLPTDEPAPYTPFEPNEKVVAFTFDDGPDWWTSYILDVLEGTGDKVSFFITGYMMDASPSYIESVRRAMNMGCDVGIHAYYHEKNVYFKSTKTDSSFENFVREVVNLDKKYTDLFGKKPQLYRPQGGGFNPMRNYGYTMILWDVDSLDWYTFDEYAEKYGGNFTGRAESTEYLRVEAANVIVDRVLSEIRPGDIVLMHDVFNISRMAFSILYPKLKEMGYKLVTVSELLGIDPEKHHGQYFFSTAQYGYHGREYNLRKDQPASPTVAALPPEKDY